MSDNHPADFKPSAASESGSKPRPGQPSDEEIDQGAEADFEAVIRHGPDVEVNHSTRTSLLILARSLHSVSLSLRAWTIICEKGGQDKGKIQL